MAIRPLMERPYWIQGEELLCYFMLANLIRNALEASLEGACVTIALTDEEDAAIIRIRNEETVPDGIRARFFEKYVTFGKQAKGTGLGTYSAKLTAETLGGAINMTTSEHEGTTITVCLPIPMKLNATFRKAKCSSKNRFSLPRRKN